MDQEQQKMIRRVGCYGCLIYVILFAFSAYTISAMGFPTIYNVIVIAIFVVLWFLTVWLISIRKKKEDFFS